jgi:glutamate dehydrogenase
LEERTGALLPDAAAAFVVAREVLGLGQLWAQVDDQTTVMPVPGRLHALSVVQQALEEGAGWLLRNRPSPLGISGEIRTLGDRVAQAREFLPKGLDEDSEARAAQQAQLLTDSGVPQDVAQQVVASRLASTALDVSEAAATADAPLEDAVGVWHAVRESMACEWLRSQMTLTAADPHWLQLAKTSLADELATQTRAFTVGVLTSTPDRGEPRQRVSAWLAARSEPVRRYQATLAEVRAVPQVDLSMLTVVAQHRRDLAVARAH